MRTLMTSGGCNAVRDEMNIICFELSKLICRDDGTIDSVAQDIMRLVAYAITIALNFTIIRLLFTLTTCFVQGIENSRENYFSASS